MGACISIHHKLSERLDRKPVTRSTRSNMKLPVMDGHVAVKPQLPPSASLHAFSDYGSKEETFFDSQAWLDSDYEDEFMSVNGEFTPSRGNTPVHHNLIPSRPITSAGHVEPLDSMAEPSPAPTEKRKRLLDFFKESQRDDHGYPDEDFAEPSNIYSDEMSSKKDGLRERPAGSSLGCFTALLSVRSTGRHNKKSAASGLKLARGPVVGS